MKLPFALFTLILLPLVTSAQDVKCDHTSNSAARFENVRILPPVRVRNYDGQHIEYTFEDKDAVYAGTMLADKDTVMDADFPKEWRKHQWWLIFCVIDRHVYAVRRLDPKQIVKK